MTEHPAPLVSVLITSYNREKYIGEAIESVLASTYENFELIIVDDASSDGTVAVINKYRKNPRIKICVNEQNIGQFENRNKAARLAKGKYVKYVDSDDIIYSWTLDYCVAVMIQYPEAGMGILYLKNTVQEECLEPAATIQKNFFQSTILNIGPIGTILNREMFENAGYFNPGYGVPSDMFFNLKMAYLYPTVLLKKDFFYYRMHSQQEFNNRLSYLCYNYKYLVDAFELPGFPLNHKQKKYVLQKAETYYTKEFLVYLKNTRDIKKAWHAFSISGMNAIKFGRGIFNLLLLKSGLLKFELSRE